MRIAVDVLLILLSGALLTLLISAWLLSLKFTRRSYLHETASPAEQGLSFERITFRTKDGLDLKGWYIPAGRSKRTVIQLHGHGGSMDPDIHHAVYLHRAGYNVLMFDFRAHGRSPGNVCSFGIRESRDALAAIEFAHLRGAKWVGLLGFSMGGMTAISTAAQTDVLSAVVVDGSPASFRTMMVAWGVERKLPGWFSSILVETVLVISSLRLGACLTLKEPARNIARIDPGKLMLIHGEADRYCPDFNDLANAVPGATIWREPGVGHVQLSVEMPERYQNKVIAFLNAH